jgi:hypothetical protein
VEGAGSTRRSFHPTCRPDLSPTNLKIFVSPSIGLPHLRRTTSVSSHHNVVPPCPSIDSALSPTPRTITPPTAKTPSAPIPRKHPPCLNARQRSSSRPGTAEGSSAAKDDTRNTAARQIPAAISQRTEAESKPRKQNLRPANIRRRQKAHGHQKVPKHDESRRHILALVSQQSRHPPLDHNGTSHPRPLQLTPTSH